MVLQPGQSLGVWQRLLIVLLIDVRGLSAYMYLSERVEYTCLATYSTCIYTWIVNCNQTCLMTISLLLWIVQIHWL